MYFTTTKKGEIHELKTDLNSTSRPKIKEAVKKVIANMTVGKDVSALFADVIKSMQTSDLELKKLIYLYIINYARSQPEKAILVVNSFQRDASDASPLIRALAIRTMGCIRVSRITDYLAEPLSRALRDTDPYVKKTAALCVAKLYDINAELVEEQGFLDELRNMISDSNAMVVANAVAALAEIAETSGSDILLMDAGMLAKMMAALNQCTEWGQVSIMDCLSKYEPDAKEAKDIIERVSPRLMHGNPAVALSAVRVILRYLKFTRDVDLETSIVETKLPQTLITLVVRSQPEVVYVALRNINLIIQSRPGVLSSAAHVRNFFCKYNDPIYVKLEKLEILVMLSDMKNVDQVLMECKQYASEADVVFIRRAVRAIGRIAIKLDRATERCMKVLLSLMETKDSHGNDHSSTDVLQESIVVFKDVFRKFPNTYESIIPKLCERLDSITEPESLSSMVWILGEYSDKIVNAPDLLSAFVETFSDENSAVQLQLLTSVVKLFLKRPQDAKEMVKEVLEVAIRANDNPDLRDRAYLYWRLLAVDARAAQAVVLAARPPISDHEYKLPPNILDSLMGSLSTLSSVHHRDPSLFLKDYKGVDFKRQGYREGDEESGSGSETSEEEMSDPEDEPEAEPAPVSSPAPVQAAPDIFDMFNAPTAVAAPSQPVATLILQAAQHPNGLQMSTYFQRANGVPTWFVIIENHGSATLTNLWLRMDQNIFGVSPLPGDLLQGALSPGARQTMSIGLTPSKDPVNKNNGAICAAFRTLFAGSDQKDIFYVSDSGLSADVLFEEGGGLNDQAFLKQFTSIPNENERSGPVQAPLYQTHEDIKARLQNHNVFFVAHRTTKKRGDSLFFSLCFRAEPVLVDLSVKDGVCTLSVRSLSNTYSDLARVGLLRLLTTRD